MGTVRTGTFAITTTTKTAQIDQQGRGSVSFTVTNTSGTNLSTRASVKFDDKSSSGWFKIDGKDERDIAVDGTEEYSVAVQTALLPKGSTPVKHWLKLRVVDVSAPEERGNESDQVDFPQPVQQGGGFPWIWLIVPAVVLVLGGIGFAIWKLWPQPVLAATVKLAQPAPPTDFGSVQVHTSSAGAIFQLVNSGTKGTKLVVTLAGANSADFQLGPNTCAGKTLDPNGGACTVQVAFEPGSLGSKVASLTFAGDTGATVPAPIGLTGTAAGTAQVCPSPKSVDVLMYYYNLNLPPPVRASAGVSITNCGTAPLTISAVHITGDLSKFSITADGCSNQTLAPGAACSVTVQLFAVVDGSWGGTIDIFDNASGSSTQFIPLSGTRQYEKYVINCSTTICYSKNPYPVKTP